MSLVYRTITLALFLLVYIIGLVGNGLLICKSNCSPPNACHCSLSLSRARL